MLLILNKNEIHILLVFDVLIFDNKENSPFAWYDIIMFIGIPNRLEHGHCVCSNGFCADISNNFQQSATIQIMFEVIFINF